MKELLIRLLNLHFVERKKYNEIWQNDRFTLVWNIPHGYAKIKNRGQKDNQNKEVDINNFK